MRMRLPQGCAGVSHAGRSLAVENGTVAVSAEAAAELAAHGLVPVVEHPTERPTERLGDVRPPAGRLPDRRPR